MKTCTACGLPAPSTTLSCALCSHPFPSQGPASYRLEGHDGGYRWMLDGEEMVSANWRNGFWDVVDTASGKVAVTLIAASEDDRVRVAMVDHRHRTVATFIPSDRQGSGAFGLVRDSYEQVMMGVRADGPTGAHVIDIDGRVLALASRQQPGREVGLDLLVTKEGACRNQTIVFSLSLALELLRVGELVA